MHVMKGMETLYEERELIRILLSHEASFALLEELYPESNRIKLKKFLKLQKHTVLHVRRSWNSGHWEEVLTERNVSGHINSIIGLFEEMQRLAEMIDIPTQARWRGSVVLTIDHYLSHVSEPVFNADGVYVVILHHEQQHSIGRVCDHCKQPFWTFKTDTLCPICNPPLQRNCCYCGQPYLIQYGGRPTNYCSPECRQAMKNARKRVV